MSSLSSDSVVVCTRCRCAVYVAGLCGGGGGIALWHAAEPCVKVLSQ